VKKQPRVVLPVDKLVKELPTVELMGEPDVRPKAAIKTVAWQLGSWS
jgi:hypothetical protein